MKQAAAILALVLIFSAIPVLILFRGTQSAGPTPAPAYQPGQRLQSNKVSDAPTITLLRHIGNSCSLPAGDVWIIRRDDNGTTCIAYSAALAIHYARKENPKKEK